MIKTHAIKIAAKWPTIEVSTTFCGKSGTQERNFESEYTTMDGRDARFEVATNGEKPTCKRCIALSAASN